MFRSWRWSDEKFLKFVAERFLPFLRPAHYECADRDRNRDHEHETQFSFHANERFSQPVPRAQLDSFGCRPRDFPTENFHSANAPGNLAMPDRLIASRPRGSFG